MRVVVTGSSGLVGRTLAADLHACGYDVVGADRAALDSSIDSWPGRQMPGDLTDMVHVDRVMAGADVLVHLARVQFPYTWGGYDAGTRTWRRPDRVGDALRFNINLAITNNVLTAAIAAGVKKIVMGSSFTIYGLYYPARPFMPDYLPVDEEHPRHPDDPYSLTKLIGEQLADACLLWNPDVQIASLRFPGVSGEDHASFADKRKNPMARGVGGLWTYVDVRDAATACRLAFERDLDGHQAFNICAPNTFMPMPSEELFARYLPGVRINGGARRGNWAGYDTGKAARLLGFEARHLLEF